MGDRASASRLGPADLEGIWKVHGLPCSHVLDELEVEIPAHGTIRRSFIFSTYQGLRATELLIAAMAWGSSVRDVAEPVGGDMGCVACFLREKDRAFLTYSTTGRGNEPVMGAFALLDMTPYGRGEAWEDNPEGWPEGHGPCWYWRSDSGGNPTWGPTSRPVPQWTRPGAPRRDPRPARPPPLTRPHRRHRQGSVRCRAESPDDAGARPRALKRLHCHTASNRAASQSTRKRTVGLSLIDLASVWPIGQIDEKQGRAVSADGILVRRLWGRPCLCETIQHCRMTATCPVDRLLRHQQSQRSGTAATGQLRR